MNVNELVKGLHYEPTSNYSRSIDCKLENYYLGRDYSSMADVYSDIVVWDGVYTYNKYFVWYKDMEFVSRLQNISEQALINNVDIGKDPFYHLAMKEFVPEKLYDVEKASNWQEKRRFEDYNDLFSIYKMFSKEKEEEINSTEDYFRAKSFFKLDTLVDFFHREPIRNISFDIIESNYDLEYILISLVNSRKPAVYKIAYYYLVCEELLKDFNGSIKDLFEHDDINCALDKINFYLYGFKEMAKEGIHTIEWTVRKLKELKICKENSYVASINEMHDLELDNYKGNLPIRSIK